MVAAILRTDPPTLGFKRLSSTFSEHFHVAHTNLREWSIEHHVSTVSLITHTLNLRAGEKSKKKSESGHVTYEIKGKEV